MREPARITHTSEARKVSYSQNGVFSALGRPSKFNEAIANRICDLVAVNQLGIRRICDDNDDLPDPQTIYRWMVQFPLFREQYARAKQAQLQALEDDMLSIADDATNDYMEVSKGKGKIVLLDKEAVLRSNLRIETRKWLMSKLLPKKYGDKMAVEHSGSVELAERIASARKRSDG